MVSEAERQARRARYQEEKARNPLLRAAAERINRVMPNMKPVDWTRISSLLAGVKVLVAFKGQSDDLDTVVQMVTLINGPPSYTLAEAIADELAEIYADAERAGYH